MNGIETISETMIVAGSGESILARPDLFEAQTRATVRFADPAAWITAAAVAHAITNSGILATGAHHEIGMIVVSDQGPTETMGEVQVAALNGFSSPLRYSAANPGSLAGVSCIAFGFRGPTLNFTMPPEQGIPVALRICAGWLKRGVAHGMVVASYRSSGPTKRISRAILLMQSDSAADTGNALTQSGANWLSRITV